jgi:biopolymer transport protein TolR
MGASLQSRKKFKRGYEPISEINVTPFVDVMLVLLIVFMVTAPLLTVGVPVDLPETKAAALNDKLEPMVITIKANGSLYVQETKVSKKTLIPRLIAVTKRNKQARIYIRGDHKLNYGDIMGIMGEINQAGYTKVALIANMPGAEKRS